MIPTCSLSKSQALLLMKDLLLVMQYRVEIYTYNRGWTLSSQASPGNLIQMEDLLEEQHQSNPIIAAVKVHSKQTEKVSFKKVIKGCWYCFYGSIGSQGRVNGICR